MSRVAGRRTDRLSDARPVFQVPTDARFTAAVSIVHATGMLVIATDAGAQDLVLDDLKAAHALRAAVDDLISQMETVRAAHHRAAAAVARLDVGSLREVRHG